MVSTVLALSFNALAAIALVVGIIVAFGVLGIAIIFTLGVDDDFD